MFSNGSSATVSQPVSSAPSAVSGSRTVEVLSLLLLPTPRMLPPMRHPLLRVLPHEVSMLVLVSYHNDRCAMKESH